MTVPEIRQPDTVPAGHLVITEELREQLRERLLTMLDAASRPAGLGDQLAPGTTLLAEEAAAIRAALDKLDDGSYGICEACTTQIPFERLDAVPSARSCVACQQRPRPLLG